MDIQFMKDLEDIDNTPDQNSVWYREEKRQLDKMKKVISGMLHHNQAWGCDNDEKTGKWKRVFEKVVE